MRVSVLSIFPEFFASPLEVSIVGRARRQGQLDVHLVDIREFASGRRRQVDDEPFGGGPGMVMMIEPFYEALKSVEGGHRVLLTPAGRPLTQSHLDRWAQLDHLTLLCGRYEGVDERVAEHLAEEEVSLGDFVLAGGEAAALAVIEGLARLLSGVLGNEASTQVESFRDGLLEEPQYTRPAKFRGWRVPEVLLSGDHERIAEWRREQRFGRTRERRPDLLDDSDK